MIADSTIERVRAATDLGELIGESVKLQRKHSSLLGLCPFHQEKTPSFHVHADRGFFYCFGCQAKGDAFRFVMETEGLSFVEAVRRLAERVGIEVEETGTPEERRQHGEARRRQLGLFEVNGAAASFFERMLREHPLRHYGRDELVRRDLLPEHRDDPKAEALRAFRLGYAPHGFQGLVDELGRLGMNLGAAVEAGLILPRRSGSGHFDRFRHRLMFAVLDSYGRVVAFSGRSLEPPAVDECRRAGLEPPREGGDDQRIAKYINSPESPVYKKRDVVFGLYQARAAIRRTEQAVVVEGNFDVVSLHARGVTNVVAPLGTAFTTEQAKQLKRHAPTAILLFDGDRAGLKAAAEARFPCREAGLYARFAALPAGKDPDDLIRERGAEAIERVVANADGLYEALIRTAFGDGFTQLTAHQQATRARRVAELIKEETDDTARSVLKTRANALLSDQLGIVDSATLQSLQRVLGIFQANHRGRPPAARPGASGAPGADPITLHGLEIFGLFLDFPQLLAREEAMVAAELIEGDAAMATAVLRQQVAARSAGRSSAGPIAHGSTQVSSTEAASAPRRADLEAESLLAKAPPSIHAFAAARLAAPQHHTIEDAMRKLRDTVAKLKRSKQTRQTTATGAEAVKAQKEGDLEQMFEVLKRRQEEFAKLGEELHLVDRNRR